MGVIAAFYDLDHLKNLIEKISTDGHAQDKNRYIEISNALRRMLQEASTATELKEKIVELTELEWQGQELDDDVTVFALNGTQFSN